MTAAGGFSFPVASKEEIISVVHEWGLEDVQLAHISGCDPSVIQRIYAVAIQRVTGISLDALDSKTEELVSGLEDYGDICAGGISLSLLLYHVQRTCAAARVQGVTLKDLVQPERAKTMNIISALINLVKFTEEQQDFVVNLQERSNNVVDERDRLDSEIEQMKEQISRIKAQRAAEEPECGDLRSNITQLESHLGATRKIQNRMLGEVEKHKRDRALAIERKMAVRNEITLAKEKRDRTQARIVQDPERMMRNLRDKAAMCQEEKAAIGNDEAKSRGLQAKYDALGGFEQDIRHNVQLLQSTELEQAQLEEAERNLQDTRTILEQKTIERSELLSNLEHARRRHENAVDKRDRAQRNAEDKQVASKNTIVRLQRDFEEMSLERRDNDKQVEETKKQIEEVEKKMAEHIWKNEGEMNELYGQYMRLRHHMDLYMETIANKLGVDLEAEVAA